MRAATVTSRMSLVKSAPFDAPMAAFLCLILDQRLWPDMPVTPRVGGALHAPKPASPQTVELPFASCVHGRRRFRMMKEAARPSPRIASLLASLLLPLALACGGTSASTIEIIEVFPSTASLIVGETMQLVATP